MSEPQPPIHETTQFQGEIRQLALADLDALQPILERWIVDRDTGIPRPDEVREDLDLMRASVDGSNGYQYFVAEENGQVVGVIGMRQPPEKLLELGFLHTNNPIELVNAYVTPEQKGGKGVGRALVSRLEDEATQQGYTEIVLNSGPRYENTGWGFYDKLAGYERVGVAMGYYGEGGDAPVWKRDLTAINSSVE